MSPRVRPLLKGSLSLCRDMLVSSPKTRGSRLFNPCENMKRNKSLTDRSTIDRLADAEAPYLSQSFELLDFIAARARRRKGSPQMQLAADT